MGEITARDESIEYEGDPYSRRCRELHDELDGKTYEASDEELQGFRAIILAASPSGSDLTEFLEELLESPSGLRAYYDATCRMEEIRATLVAEGLLSPPQDET